MTCALCALPFRVQGSSGDPVRSYFFAPRNARPIPILAFVFGVNTYRGARHGPPAADGVDSLRSSGHTPRTPGKLLAGVHLPPVDDCMIRSPLPAAQMGAAEGTSVSQGCGRLEEKRKRGKQNEGNENGNETQLFVCMCFFPPFTGPSFVCISLFVRTRASFRSSAHV